MVEQDVVGAIGRTPLIRLRRASELSGGTVLGKAEFLNPGGSVKDRAALALIRAGLESGAVRPGGLVVEGTAGNTGIGLATLAPVFGLRTIIVMPDTQSQEKKDALRLAGATVLEVPAVPYREAGNYVKVAGRLAAALAEREPHGAMWANQFDDTANRDAHAATTAPEIWDDTGGAVDGFICAVGTGGTLAGTAAGLRARRPDIRIGVADPWGSGVFDYVTRGVFEASGSSVTEGIGQGRLTGNLQGLAVDHAYRIADEEALPILFDLVAHEGLCLGGSSGINVAGAIRMGRELGPGRTVVTIRGDWGAGCASEV